MRSQVSQIDRFYEQWYRSAGDGRQHEIRDRDIMAVDAVRGCESVFELGCGSGAVLRMIPAAYRAGVDISDTAISLAKEALSEDLLDRRIELEKVNVDQNDLPWPDETFDCCLAIEVLEHLFDPVHALAELNRIMKHGGKLVVAVPNIGYYRFRCYHLKSGEVSDFHGNGLVVNEHIRYYGKRSLSHLLALTGFEQYSMRGARKAVLGETPARQAETRRRVWQVSRLLQFAKLGPMRILGKMNSLLRLWDKYPSMFAVGLVCVAEKVDKSRFSRNAAVDHKKRTTEDEAVNVNTL